MDISIEGQYLTLLRDILEEGVHKNDRTGTGTISIFGRQIRHDMSNGFPLLTTKRIKFDLIVTELLWFLRGDTNIKYLLDNNCHIWDGDCYQAYLRESTNPEKDNNIEADLTQFSKEQFINKIKNDKEFSDRFGNLGPIYGKQWRNWGGKQVSVINDDVVTIVNDQIQNLIDTLKTDPDSRRLLVNAYNISELDQMVLPPCHYSFQVWTRELTWEEQIQWVFKNTDVEMENLYIVEEIAKDSTPKLAISLMFNMRSTDVPLGLPFNIASYALLLEIIGKMVNAVPDELIASLGDAHIYKNQIEEVSEQLTRTGMKLPGLIISDEVDFSGTIADFLESCNPASFRLEGYESHPAIRIPLSN